MSTISERIRQAPEVCEWPVGTDCDRNNPTLTRHGQPICEPCNTFLDDNAARISERVAAIRQERGRLTIQTRQPFSPG